MALQIEPFNRKKHNRSTFDCGVEDLNRYLRSSANQDLKKRIATVFVLVDSNNSNIIAYYTLSAYTIEITELEDSLAKRLPRYPILPATLLGRLAVDKNYRNQRYGELMLIDALKNSLLTTKKVASLALIAEAKSEQAAKFYSKYSFIPFLSNPLKLYLAMKSIEKLNII